MGRADGDDPVADRHVGARAEGRGLEALRALELDQGDVGQRVGAEDLGVEHAAVVELDLELVGVVDDVVVGDHEAVAAEDHAGADALARLGVHVEEGEHARVDAVHVLAGERVAGLADHAHVDHARGDLLDQRGQAAPGVEAGVGDHGGAGALAPQRLAGGRGLAVTQGRRAGADDRQAEEGEQGVRGA
jgi:hypothetical protein